MKNKSIKTEKLILMFSLLIFCNSTFFAQQTAPTPAPKSAFWEKVKFGGGLGLSFGTFTNVTIAPSAKYAVSEQVSVGTGLQYSYISSNNLYKSNIFGGSLFTLYDPIPEIQLSLDVEELNVNSTFEATNGFQAASTNFWTTALFVGAGYNLGGITVGGRYNVLFDKNKSAYSQAFMPYVRVFF